LDFNLGDAMTFESVYIRDNKKEEIRKVNSNFNQATLMVRKAIMRGFWQDACAMLSPIQTYIANPGSVVYIDPNSVTNGVGTFADPRNAWPTTFAASTAYLLKERTRIISLSALNTIGAGGAHVGCLIGTYDAATGARILDKSRLATIDGTTFARFAVRYQGTSGDFTLSGVRIVGCTNAGGGIQMFESITSTGVTTIVVEHCVFEDMGAFQLVSGSINNQAINIAGTARLIARFNRINVKGDGLLQGATGGLDCYCNIIITPSNITNSGPDCIQILRTTTASLGKINVYLNWLDQQANCKQAFIISGGTPQANGEQVYFANNFCWGVDTLAVPPLGPDGQSHIAFNCDSLNGTVVVGNYFDQWAGWASVTTGGVLMHNIGYRDHGGAFFAGFGASVGSSGAIIANNTALAGPATQIGTDTAYEIQGSGIHTVKNNAVVGPWVRGMRINASTTTESNSLFYNCVSNLLNGSNAAISLSGSSITVDPIVDILGRPRIGSSLLAAGSAVRDSNGVLIRYVDSFGFISSLCDAPNIGASAMVM
jgi:hypothetical protein